VENLLTFLPLLACPLMMGVMMWIMMRGRTNQTSDAPSAVGTPARPPVATAQAARLEDTEPDRPNARPLWSALGLCLNWNVVAALAIVGVAIWIVAPGLIWAAVPVLLLAVCPLSMLLMMRGMPGTQQSTAHLPQTSQSAAAPLSREEQLSELRGRLASTQAEQHALAREITALERGHTGIERPAEAAARGANGRGAP